ncbi:MAG TPA: flagellin lysine-N-methylase [Bryobacteraceae bacterium]|nr:flagellin lysine-N-methylase [Bryobacteraceae bacterium]
MQRPTRVLKSLQYGRFRCLGADCEDTCCDGWAVTVDRPAYERFQQCSDPAWRSSFEKFVTVNAEPAEHSYATIQLSGTTCPFLSEGLCSVHQRFGEEFLPVTCASFPRVWNVVDQTLEQSLDPGCPEAARLVLLDPGRAVFEEADLERRDFSEARLASVETAAGGHSKTYRHFGAVRKFVIGLLQNRALPLAKRVQILSFFCEKLQEAAAGGAERQIPELVQGYEAAVNGGLFDQVLNQLSAIPAARLETVLELIVSRITSDFTNKRFLETYKTFMEGIEWTSHSTMEEIAARQANAYARYYAPFLERHGYMLEHYLVNYVYRGLFPFGPQESTDGLRKQNIQRSIQESFLLLAVYFAVIQTLLAGLAGFHKDAFGPPHVIQVVYTFTRTFEHSLAFPTRMMEILKARGWDNAMGAAVLVNG